MSSCTSMRAPPRLLPPALPSAESTGVFPRASLALRSAPRDTRNVTTSFQPQRAASCRAVRPRESFALMSPPGVQQQLQRLDRSLLRVFAQVEATRVGIHRSQPRCRHRWRHRPAVGERQIGAFVRGANGLPVRPALWRPQQRRRPGRQHPIESTVVADVAEGRREAQARVRVGARVEQQPDDVEAAGFVERRQIGAPSARDRVDIDRRVERASSPEIPLVRIGARTNQLRGGIELHVDDRRQQRAESLGIGEVQLGALVDQGAGAFDAPLAGSIESGVSPPAGR